MPKIIFLLLILIKAVPSFSQVSNPVFAEEGTSGEMTRIKKVIYELKSNEIQNDKSRYEKNYLMIVNGLEIIKEIHQGSLEISAARNQNIFYKKLIDINNPSSNILGFQLLDVMTKTLEENINQLPLVPSEKKRMNSQIGNLFEGLRQTFPPLQILASAFSAISSFTTFRPKIERINRKEDSITIETSNPITKEMLQKINGQLQPYITFYSSLDRVNNIFETALYQHDIEYRDFMEEVKALKQSLESKIDIDLSIASQVNNLFNLSNLNVQDFSYRQQMKNDTLRDLTGICSNINYIVERYKKFSNDFIIIQDDFYKNNIDLLKNKTKALPYRDDSKIDQLISELEYLRNGSPAQNVPGFDTGYKLRLKSILAKLHIINRLKFS